ncbi:hypothetical protein ACG2LH_16185 [Zhouia sp. PK063]|uniref:hypothetical protein n=1 Tax=Zhouia sp. PK063 TaxID=3373602 RepID=UPI00378A9CDB
MFFLKKQFLFVAITFCGLPMTAQHTRESNNPTYEIIQPYLFSINSLRETNSWSVQYAGSYGERVSGPFGYEGIDQQFAVKGYVGAQFTFYGKTSFGFPKDGDINSAQQAEVICNFIGNHATTGFRFGAGLGVSRDYASVFSTYSRLVLSFEKTYWRIISNIVLEKAFKNERDAIDVTTSIGYQYQVLPNFYAGVEALGEDLEGFWEEDEAEGGAKLLVGPSIHWAPNNSRFAFSMCGGPVIYATHNAIAVPSEAIRDLPLKNGFTVRALLLFNLHS